MKFLTLFLLIILSTPIFASYSTAPQSELVVNCHQNGDEVNYIADSIMQYLRNHPQAADTAEGITKFWINWPGDLFSLVLVSCSLELLESAGLIERVKIGKRTLWRLPRVQFA